MSSKYFYGGVDSVVQVREGVVSVKAAGSLTPRLARDFALALLEAANEAEVVVPDLPVDGCCQDCGQEAEHELLLYEGLYGVFWACEHCYDARVVEE